MRRARGAWGVALLVVACAPGARAQDPPCPIDGQALARRATRAWNAGAGVDSDGCRWGLAADGTRRVVGQDDLLECGRCGGAFLQEHLAAPWSPAAVEAAHAAIAADVEARGADLSALPRRFERAAELRAAALTAEGAAPGDAGAEAGALLLRAAWVARGEAAGGAADGGYRPWSVEEARARLEALEERVRRGADQDPALAHLEAAGQQVDALRAVVGHVEERLPEGDVAGARARQLLGELERRLLEAQARLAPPGWAAETGIELVLARAWTRFGDPERRERWLAAALARHGAAIAAEVQRVRDACAEEARLLGRARARFEAAAAEPLAPGHERARRLFLAGDAARRRGEAQDARRLLQRAAEADPQGRLAATARALGGS